MILIAFEQLLAESQTRISDADAVFTALYDEDVVADEDAIIKWCTDLESAIGLDGATPASVFNRFVPLPHYGMCTRTAGVPLDTNLCPRIH